MRYALAAFLVLHGLAHLVGFLTPWGMVPRSGAGAPTPSTNLLFGGRVRLGTFAARGASMLWFTGALAFVVVAIGVLDGSPWWLGALVAISALSLLMTLAWWPTARIGSIIDIGLLVGIVGFGYYNYRTDLRIARSNSLTGSVMLNTSAGPIEYAAVGHGAPILVLHGTGGGWDQGLTASSGIVRFGYRVIAPSRFGYLRTPMPPNASPAKEADLWVTLLDSLGIDRVAVMGFSAGASPAMQFALRHPDRVSRLVLVVPASGGIIANPPAGPPAWVMHVVLKSDFPMWVTRHVSPTTLYKLVGVPPSLVPALPAADREELDRVIDQIFPVSTRRNGIAYDARDQMGSEGLYPLDKIAVPTLLISAEDDRYQTLTNASRAASLIPGARIISYPTGGHLLLGHNASMWPEVAAFLSMSTSLSESASRAVSSRSR